MKKSILNLSIFLVVCLFIGNIAQAQNTWAQKASFPAAPSGREGAVAFSIGAKGYVGTGLDGLYRKDFWEYDPTADTWTQKANFGGTARQNAVGFSINSKGYVGTGFDGSFTNDFWEYDPSTNVWTQKANFTGGPRTSAAGFGLGNYGYIGTGYANGYKSDFWRYDPSNDTWVQKQDVPGPARRDAASVSINGGGYVGAGQATTGYQYDFYLYQPSNDTWYQKANIGSVNGPFVGRYQCASFSIGAYGYICTGSTTTDELNELWEFDQSINNWSLKASFPGSSRKSAIGFSIGAKGYVCAGRCDTSTNIDPSDFYEFDQTNNRWTQKANIGKGGRESAFCFSIGNKGYIGTGNDGTLKSDFWEYNVATDSWTQKASYTAGARENMAGFSIGNKGYAGCGYDPSGPGYFYADFYEYDPSTNTWTRKADFGGTPRAATVSFNIGNKGYIGTGTDSHPQKDFWEYDPNTNTWVQKAVYPGVAIQSAAGFSIGSKAYVGTGFDGSGYVNSFYEYDQATDTWTQKANYGGTARGATVGMGIGTLGYIGTGFDQTGHYTNDFWSYDPAIDSWTLQANLGGYARQEAVGFSIGYKGYIVAGQDASNIYNDVWEYTPVCIQASAPTNTTSPSAQVVCSGSNTILSATGSGAISWYDAASGGNYLGGGNTYTTNIVTSPTTYYAQDSTCGASATRTAVAVTVNPKPSPTVTLLNNDTLSTSSFSTYQWLMDGAPITNATTNNYLPTVTGNYSVVVTDANGCTDTSAAYNFVRVGIEGIAGNEMYSIYPNPNHGKFILNIGNATKQLKIELLNVEGQILYTEQLKDQSSFKKELNFSDLAKGVYLLKVSTENGVAVKRVVVE